MGKQNVVGRKVSFSRTYTIHKLKLEPMWSFNVDSVPYKRRIRKTCSLVSDFCKSVLIKIVVCAIC
jgi:hypothetical protein